MKTLPQLLNRASIYNSIVCGIVLLAVTSTCNVGRRNSEIVLKLSEICITATALVNPMNGYFLKFN